MNSILHIFAFYFAGEYLTDLLHLPFPGSISGFLLALLTILLIPTMAPKLKAGSEALLGYLPLFLVPVAVSIFFLFQDANKKLYFFGTVILAALVFGIVLTAFSLNAFMRKQGKKEDIE
jgi:holin-like protein